MNESMIAEQPSSLNMGTTALDFLSWMNERLARTEDALSRWVGVNAPAGLGEAMRYAVLDGGKRLRPLLVWAASEAVGGQEAAALRAGCAVELIHAYSLVHDDMPCMDNDVLRRGKPTVHVQFGESSALLAGDALQALAFELLVLDEDDVPCSTQAKLCRLLGAASGCQGMAGGQAIDLASVGKQLTEAQLREMHRLKTGALLLGRHWGWLSRWWMTFWMWWQIRPLWARRQARMRPMTSPPMFRCWGLSKRVPMPRNCAFRPMLPWRAAACLIRRRWQRWLIWSCSVRTDCFIGQTALFPNTGQRKQLLKI